MSIGRYFNDFQSFSDMFDDFEEESGKLGGIERFDISLRRNGEKFGIIISPKRIQSGRTVCLSTGDNAVGIFDTRSEAGHTLNQLISELKTRDYKVQCFGSLA